MFLDYEENLRHCTALHARYAEYIDPAIGPISMAASPQLGAVLIELIKIYAPPCVIETGTGFTTLVLGECVNHGLYHVEDN